MREEWTVFEGRQYRSKRDADLRDAGVRGTFYLNAKAFDALGSPEAVEMMFEGNTRTSG